MSKASKMTPTTKDLVGEECQLFLNDGGVISKPRVVRITAADSCGVSYKWSFRGSSRDDFVPWSSIYEMRLRLGKGKGKDLPDRLKAVKPSHSGNKIVKQWVRMTRTSGLRPDVVKKAFILAIDQAGVGYAYSYMGQEYVSFTSHQFVVNLEVKHKNKNAPKPPSPKKD